MSDAGPPADPADAAKARIPADPARLTTREKRAHCVALRAAGLSFEEIADALGYANRSGAWKATMKALDDYETESVERLRNLELRRLDDLLAGGTWRRAMLGDEKAVNAVLRIMEARRRYVPGLEVPRSTELTGLDGAPVTVVFEVPDPATAGGGLAVVAEDDLARLPDPLELGAGDQDQAAG